MLRIEKFEARVLLSANSMIDSGSDFYGPLPLADDFNERLILRQLATASQTAYLQDGVSDLSLVETSHEGTRTTSLFQQLHAGIPIYGAYVTVVQEGENSFESYDRGYEEFVTSVPAEPGITSDQVSVIAADANFTTPDAIKHASLAWHQMDSETRLVWQVDTLDGSAGDSVDQTTLVDAHSGQIVDQQRSVNDEIEYLLEYPETIKGVYPRIVINDSIGPTGSRAYADPFDSVVSISVGCTGSLIAPAVVISARHCSIGSGDLIRFGDNSSSSVYTATVASNFLPAGNGTLLDGGDVAVLTLTQDVPESVATPMRLTDDNSSLVGQVAATVGYGYNGIGSDGHNFTADGFRWGGENIIDAYGSPAATSGSNIFSTDFDNGSSGANTISASSSQPITYEATTAPGDSGGPILVQKGGEWVIAGVLSGGTTSTSVYGDISWWTGVAPFKAEIESRGGQFVSAGSVSLDADTYVDGDTVFVTVDDFNAISPVEVTLTSDSGDVETVSLTNASGSAYVGSIALSSSNVTQEDGTLQGSNSDQISVTYVDPDDGTGGSATVTDTAVILAGDVATGETNVSGSVASGSYLDTYVSDDVSEVIREERYGGRRSRLEHRWNFNVTGGLDVTFNLEARLDSSADNFDFEYSTNAGSSWNSMVTVTQSTDTTQTFSLGNGISGDVLVRVLDTDRSRGDSSLDSIFIDAMFFSATPSNPTPGITIEETGGSTATTEGGAGDTYSVSLNTVPASNVTITVTPDLEVDLGSGPGTPVNLVFTPLDPLPSQTITVNAVDDTDLESAHSGLITHTTSSSDGDYDGLVIPDVNVSITDNDGTGGATSVATGENSVDGSITQGSYLDTQISDNQREVVSEERYAGNKRTRLQHRWSFDVTGGTDVTFQLEAYHDSSAEDFVFEYSTNAGSSWTPMVTVEASSETAYSVNLGSGIAGDVLVRVIDTDRSRNENVIDSIFINAMYFEPVAAASGRTTATIRSNPTPNLPATTGSDTTRSSLERLADTSEQLLAEFTDPKLDLGNTDAARTASWNQLIDIVFHDAPERPIEADSSTKDASTEKLIAEDLIGLKLLGKGG